MKCNEVKNRMLDYLSNDSLPQEIKEHLAHCSDCNAEFEQLQHLIQTLKPKVKVCASDDFTRNTITKINKLNMEDKKMKKFPFYLKAAVLLVLLTASFVVIFLNTNSSNQVLATPVNQIFTESIREISKSKSMHIGLEIKTLEGDNFEFIGTEYDFVKHEIKVEFSPKKWTIEKSGRKVLFDGKSQYLDIQNLDYVMKGDAKAGFVDWLHILLTPNKILEKEKQNLIKDQSTYDLKETDNQLILTVSSKAQGNFTNDYMKNTSVSNSDNERVYIFDKATYQLRSFELYVVENQEKFLIMKTTDIKYDVTFDAKEFSAKIFGSKEIKSASKLELKADKTLISKTPEEITRYFFEACATSDWKKVEKVYPHVGFLFKRMFGGIEIVEIGQSFQSGNYPGHFVPYTIKLKSGDIRTMNLAVRNDNPQQIWSIDGGF